MADFHFDGEAVIYFPSEVLFAVAGMARAKKKRYLSEEHKAKLAEAGKAHQFKPKTGGSKGEGIGVDLDDLA